MPQLFDRFLQERRYLKNVSPRTIEWHEQSLKWLGVEQPTETDLRDFVLRMRTAGLKASSVNCRIGSVNAYLGWTGSLLRIPKLKQEKLRPCHVFHKPDSLSHALEGARILSTPVVRPDAHALLDTGIRLDEALSLCVQDCNLDDLLLTVTGKGRKQRIIPFSMELRRLLAKFVLDFCPHPQQLIFSTKQGRKLSQRNVLRDMKNLCDRLGFPAPRRTIHATRHTFATEYLRRGGSLFHLQKVLGHTTLEMVRRYANLVTADLQAVHQRVSLLSA